MAGVLLEVLDHGVYKVLVNYDDCVKLFIESRHVKFDESRIPGAPDFVKSMEYEVFDDDTWNTDNSGSKSDESCEMVDKCSTSDESVVSVDDEYYDGDVHDNGDAEDIDLDGYFKIYLDHAVAILENDSVHDSEPAENRHRYPNWIRNPPPK